ncbi:MAG TPA: hypothetical protein ENK39_06010 [Epsilonproteobacteria bacterium]|nr:hypothetical protein [Campylobacterota bacterium]
MFKKSIFIFLLTLLFSGCAERGSLVSVPTPHKINANQTEDIPKLVLHNSREDALKKGISGSLILIIGFILIF